MINQKSFLGFVTIGLAMGLLSCKEDTLFNPLLGSWQYAYETYANCDDPTDEGQFDFPCNATECFKVTYADNGEFTQYSLIAGTTTTLSGTYSVEGDALVLCTPGCGNPMPFTTTDSALTFIFEDDAGCTVNRVLEKLN